MARPTTLNYWEIQNNLIKQGFDITDVGMEDGRLTIKFNCTNCGKSYVTLYDRYKKGQNPNFYCKDCQALKGPKMKRIQDYFDSMGVEIAKVDLNNRKHWYIYFPCKKCGVETKIMDDYVGKNNKELCCKHCRENTAIPTQSSLEEYFRDRGSELLSKYESYHAPLKFRCTKCGCEAEGDLAHIKGGYNPNLLCRVCSGMDSSRDFENFVKEKNIEVLEEYKGVENPILIRCTRCGKPFKFHYNNYRYSNKNPYIICSDCVNGYTGRDMSKRNNVGRNKLDDYWRRYLKDFFNIPTDEKGKYDSHHIIRYIVDEDYATSFLNGYPLKSELHIGNKGFYHNGPGQEIKNWTGEEKLPYHNYDNFEFLDLNSKYVSEILYPTTPMRMNELYKKKQEYAKKGIQYIPFYLTDLNSSEKRELAFSMLRARVHKDFPTIYEYTGTHLIKYYARKLKLVKPTALEAELFFNKNHIQGFVHSSVYIGLADEDGVLISCMSFNKPRFKSNDTYDYDMTRFATKINSVVIGGASKIFKAFIDEYKPQSVVSFCDVRFSSIDPNEVVYTKLGFDYCGFSEPNYGYRDPKTGVVLSRRACQKHLLSKKLEIFDEKLSESQNMEMNGYVRQVDCGSFKFVWGKHFWF